MWSRSRTARAASSKFSKSTNASPVGLLSLRTTSCTPLGFKRKASKKWMMSSCVASKGRDFILTTLSMWMCECPPPPPPPPPPVPPPLCAATACCCSTAACMSETSLSSVGYTRT